MSRPASRPADDSRPPTEDEESHPTDVILSQSALSFPFKTPDPFIFAVYHKDNYPAGNDLMEAPRRGDGADFNNPAG